MQEIILFVKQSGLLAIIAICLYIIMIQVKQAKKIVGNDVHHLLYDIKTRLDEMIKILIEIRARIK